MANQEIIMKETENQNEKVASKKGKKGWLMVAGAAAVAGICIRKVVKHFINKNSDESTECDPFEGVDEPIEGLDLNDAEE